MSRTLCLKGSKEEEGRLVKKKKNTKEKRDGTPAQDGRLEENVTAGSENRRRASKRERSGRHSRK